MARKGEISHESCYGYYRRNALIQMCCQLAYCEIWEVSVPLSGLFGEWYMWLGGGWTWVDRPMNGGWSLSLSLLSFSSLMCQVAN